ncbi:hypothetical protein [uncultured Draconibacterium sp.]|uniref:hypothetical protein n=1 Tax=uncultured Draconibacterium sp. TaxID=1573823 RepID=UPI0032615084
MRLQIFSVLIFLFFAGFAQDADSELKVPETIVNGASDLEEENLKYEFKNYDFSTLMVPRQDFLGFIGDDYLRIQIFFTSVVKDSSDADLYRITGASLVKNNKCEFSGTIRVKQVIAYKNMHFGLENKYENRGLKKQGILIGAYELKENPSQYHSGVFKGKMYLNWYVDQHDILHYDNIERHSDNYKNNQYVGTWSGYNSESRRVCNWGESRIPFSGDLDIGAGEFSPNSNYYNQGWEELKIE